MDGPARVTAAAPDDRPGVGVGLLVARSAFASAAALLSGVLAHVSAGGLLPSLVVVVALWSTGLWAMAAFLARPASALRLVTLVVGGQTGVHLVLTLTAGHAGDEPSAGGGAPAPAAHLLHHLTEQSPLMVAAHLVAAVGLGLWLAVGERALWTLAALTVADLAALARVLPMLGRPASPTSWCARVPAPEPRARPVTVLLSASVSRRGPPPVPALA